MTVSTATKIVITCDGLEALMQAVVARGYQLLGPSLRDGAIVYDDVARLADLPRGMTDEQAPGRYRLAQRDDQALFGYAVGPQSWKRFLHPPLEKIFEARRDGTSFTVTAVAPKQRYAFLGVRACEIHAIAIQDKVFLEGPYVDAHYQSRRADNLIIAVNCGQAAATCFCASMGTGPKAESGFDLALTELLRGPQEPQEFLVEIGSEAGRAIVAAIRFRAACEADVGAADAVVAATATQMGRRLETDGLKDLLQENLDHPRWDEVASRCLACANCTMVCPTCFCTTVTDHNDLTGEVATRERAWDSCFTLDFSYLHGGSVRKETRSRYRQWMTHKLAHWIDQFGTSGCVGCGRCITWCPVGIDLTEEAAAIRATPGAKRGGHAD